MYGSKDGLSNNIVRNITQDKFGHIWIGTENGLNRFSGNQFINYLHRPGDSSSISNNLIFGLITDDQGVVWVGTDNGLNLFDPSTQTFTAFKASDDANSLSNNHVRSIFKDRDNNIWVGTEDGLNLFQREDSTFHRFSDDRVFTDRFGKASLSHNRINSIIQDDLGRIWVGSDGGGVKVYNDRSGTFTPLILPPAEEDRLFNIIRTIYQDGDGTFWFGCDGGLVRYIEKQNQFSVFNPQQHPDSLGFKYIWSLVEDDKGNLWAGSYGGGLFTFDKDKETFTSHRQLANRSTDYDDNLIWPLFKDRDGNIWVGFDGNGGVGFYHPNARKFEHLLGSKSSDKKYNVSSIVEISPDSLLIDSSKERFLLVNDTEYVPLDHLSAGFAQVSISMKLEDGYLFTGNDQLVMVDTDFKLKYHISDENIGMVVCGITDPKNNVWLGTLSSGLMHFNPQTRSRSRFFTEGHLNIYTDSRSIASINYQSDSVLWVGAMRYGLVKFNPINNSKQHFLYKDSIFDEPTITSIKKARNGDLWLGTEENGLLKFNPKTEQVETKIEGFQIKEIIIDRNDKLWISTTDGVLSFDPASGFTHKFGVDDGLQGSIFNKAFFKSPKGSLYFGGENGINRFQPDAIVLDSTANQLLIEEVSVNNVPLQWSLDEPIHEIEELSLEHNQSDISIVFAANSFLHTDQYRYEYEVNNNGWRSLENQNQVNLSNLSPGTYLIKVRSANHDGIKSDMRRIVLNISPPWHGTWWFRLFAALSIVLAIAFYYILRIRRMDAQKGLLEQQVQDRTKELNESKQQIEQDKVQIEKALKERESLLKEIHHRVKNNLQIIASLLYLQSGKFDDDDYKKVLEEGQGRVRSMALIHQKLYENDDLKSIPFEDYLQELVSEIRASFGMSNIQLHIAAENVFFDVDTAVPLGLIVNELATNSFKYAFEQKESGSFSINLKEVAGQYVLTINDDGVGIPPTIDIRKTKSLGLRLVRMLSQQLEGDFKIENREGTSYQLKFAA